MSDADKAAARVEAFLPELADVPDESRAARLGAKQLADDVRLVFDDRELLRAEVARLKAELDEATDLDRSALKTQELRDERSRAVARWHDQKKRADRANETLAAIRLLVAKWAGPTTAGERMLAGEILALTGGQWTEDGTA